ncbi:MAG TPA: SDR family NAD(P)-dependent oxidoreductase [Bradyrhizobium sp.]|jgi:NAD(P)-dependent dehydrogenase (short-subunit alcohol dehydrogenase family)|nr:SDR family NAD(P)-dependent oxidoreductase [Bradyrhizobium sp.]
MTGQVQGKVAPVTGGASGIGEAVAELLAREGASVAVTDIDDLKGPEVVAGIKKAGHEAVFLHQDVTSESRWVEVVTEVESFRDAPLGAGPESILPVVVMDSGLARSLSSGRALRGPVGAPRNDEVIHPDEFATTPASAAPAPSTRRNRRRATVPSWPDNP